VWLVAGVVPAMIYYGLKIITPAIFLGIITGGIMGAVVQGNSFGDLLSCAYGGFVSETGVEAIDDLVTSGGLENMMYSISLTILSMMFGEIMESTGQLEVIVNHLIKIAKGTTFLVTPTILTSDSCSCRIVCLNLGYFFHEAMRPLDTIARSTLRFL
jgi:Na+/H+ antiporter NhaC